MRDRFDIPTPDQIKEEHNEKMELQSLPPDVMKERAIVLLGTVNACLDNLEILRHSASNDVETPKEQRPRRVEYRKIIDDHVNQVKIMIETGKIKLDDCLTFLVEERQQRLKELFDRDVMEYLVSNRLN